MPLPRQMFSGEHRAERLALLEAIVSEIVHEIRNPLVSLKAFSQLPPARFDGPEFRAGLVRVADREISRIDELLGRFRTLASAPALPMGLVDLVDPCPSALELLFPKRETPGVRRGRVGIEPVREIGVNSSQFEQHFHNLCLNALEAMTAGEELTVRVADLCEAGGSTLLVENSDIGRGIPDAHRVVLNVRNHSGRPSCAISIEFPVPDRRLPKIHT